MIDKYEVLIEFNTLCCKHPIKIGSILEISKQTSKNRLSITHNVGSHNVKKSTFFRCTERITNEI